MLTCGIKASHGGGVVLIEDGHLLASIDVEKIDNDSPRTYTSYHHASRHLLESYCTSPFAQRGEDALVVWDGGMLPRAYHVSASGVNVRAIARLLPLLGVPKFCRHFEPSWSARCTMRHEWSHVDTCRPQASASYATRTPRAAARSAARSAITSNLRSMPSNPARTAATKVSSGVPDGQTVATDWRSRRTAARQPASWTAAAWSPMSLLLRLCVTQPREARDGTEPPPALARRT
jgi:hypothetical protein